jgi:hypothetical protein
MIGTRECHTRRRSPLYKRAFFTLALDRQVSPRERQKRKLTRQIAVKVGIPRFLEKGLIDGARSPFLGAQCQILSLRGRRRHPRHERRLGRDALWLWLLRRR